MAEVDGVRRPRDDDHGDVVGHLGGDLQDAVAPGHERVTAPEHGERGHLELEKSLEGRVVGERGEQPQGVDRPELHVVGDGDLGHPRALAYAVHGKLPHRATQWSVLEATGRRDQDHPRDAFGVPLADLDDDRAAHGVADQVDRLEMHRVEDRDERVGELGDGERLGRPLAATITGQVRNHLRSDIGKQQCGRHEVGPRYAEAVNVHHRDRARVLDRRAHEHAPTVDQHRVVLPPRIQRACHGPPSVPWSACVLWIVTARGRSAAALAPARRQVWAGRREYVRCAV